jgi:type I restriction enzyme S subunit
MNSKILVGKAIKFNPSELISKGSVAKKIPMGALTEFQRKINGFEYSEYNSGPKFRNGDTLVAKITPCLENGKTAFVDILENDEVAFGSSEFIVLRRTEYTTPEFIYYFARSPLFRERAISCMEGTSGRKRVNENSLKNLEFIFPDLTTQKSIAKVLSDLDAKIELNNKINRELEAMAKTLYDYWFVQFDFPNAYGKPYKSSGGKMVYNAELKREIPEGWAVKKLGDLGDFKNGVNYDPSNPGEIACPIINVRNISASSFFIKNEDLDIIYLRESDVRKYSVNAGSIIIARSGIPGATRMISDIAENTLYCGFAIHYSLNNLGFKIPVFFFLKSLEEHIQSGSGGTILKNVNQGTLNALKIVLPKEDSTVSKFNNLIEPIFGKITNVQRQNQHLTALRDWLLPMLMNGQVTVRQAHGNAVQEAEDKLSMAAEPSVKYGS